MENLKKNNNVNSNSGQTTEDKYVIDQKILSNIKAMKGEVPPPLKIMSMRPGTLTTFMSHRNQILENGPLTERERALIGVGIAVAMQSSKCVFTQSNNARQAGATEDEIVQGILIASLMMGASPLRAAYSAVQDQYWVCFVFPIQRV